MSDSLHAVCQDLKRNNGCLTMVNLNCACLGNDGSRVLASALKPNSKVLVLFLNQNQFQGRSQSWKQLSHALSHHPSLTHLYLSHNPGLGNHGATLLAQAYSSNTTTSNKLRVLRLSNCNIGDAGVRALSWWLAEATASSGCCCVLQTLDLQQNPDIGPPAMQAMARALKRNDTLHTIDLQGCTAALEEPCRRLRQQHPSCDCDCWRSKWANTLEQGNVTLCHIRMDQEQQQKQQLTTTTRTTTATATANSSSVCHERLELYTTLNQWGRRYFGTATLTPTLWGRVLGRAKTRKPNRQQTSLLFYLIRARPDLVAFGRCCYCSSRRQHPPEQSLPQPMDTA